MLEKLSTRASLWVFFAAGATISAMILVPLAIILWSSVLSDCGSF
jgi:fumarate reductase subunit D